MMIPSYYNKERKVQNTMNKFIAKSLSFVLAASLIFCNTSIVLADDVADYSEESIENYSINDIPAETEADICDLEESEAAPADETEAAESIPMEYEIPEQDNLIPEPEIIEEPEDEFVVYVNEETLEIITQEQEVITMDDVISAEEPIEDKSEDIIPEESSLDNEDMDAEATEESIVEEIVEGTVSDELIIGESSSDKLVIDETIIDESITDESVNDDLVTDEAGMDEPTADESIVDASVSDEVVSDETGIDDLVGDEPENEEPVFVDQDLSETVSGSVVSVNGDMPEGATISVVASDRTTYVDQLADKFVPLKAFDINVVCVDDSNYQPSDYGKTLTITFTGIDTSRHIVAYRIDEESGDITELPVSIDGDTVSVVTDHFTIYELGYTDTDIVETYIVNSDITATLFNDGTLYIEGTGEMPGYNTFLNSNPSILDTPWRLDNQYGQISSVIIGEGITRINDNPTYGLFGANVREVSLPSTLTYIGDYAFAVTSITSITIPSTVTEIGEYVFYYCHSLTTVNLCNGLTRIGCKAFCGTGNLKSIVIPKTVELEGCIDAFDQCDGLESIVFSEGIQFIPSRICAVARNLVDVSIPNSVIEIGRGAFSGCVSLSQIDLPDDLRKIGDSAFALTGLTEFNIPTSVEEIGCYFFQGTKITTLTIPENISIIPWGAFYDCTELTTVNLGNSVTSIDGNAFKDCNNLTLITGGDNITWCSSNYVFHVESEKPLMVRTNSDALRTYDYAYDNRIVTFDPPSYCLIKLPALLELTEEEDLFAANVVVSVEMKQGVAGKTNALRINLNSGYISADSVNIPLDTFIYDEDGNKVFGAGSEMYFISDFTDLSKLDVNDRKTYVDIGTETNVSLCYVYVRKEDLIAGTDYTGSLNISYQFIKN